ncbi:hypothetical protein [Paenibacillus glacialis]|uniref:Uncharacterized protein n=1 Tax=Paenibacillus glacialis TaxID=494026 RepID=A0A168KSQ0_9BACL|nr:hypothetical protein [Paenibacillus glacialis]OAB42414.1 hypothetical protein PGLA_12125 [Paenibacillus glacialis]
MRRYWISIVLSVFIVVGLGTYYVYGAVVRFPEYKISKVSGDVNEGTKIVVQGGFLEGGRYQSIFATAEGSDYPIRSNLFTQMFWGTGSGMTEQTDIRQIIKDHRSFMRGKGKISNFYKDDKWIIYADAVVHITYNAKTEIVLSIDLLNKTTGVVKHYETKVDDSTNYSQTFIEDVQLNGEQIHLLISQRSTGIINGSEGEYRDYAININSGAITNNGRIAFGDTTKDYVELFDRSIMNSIVSSPSDYAILSVTDQQPRVNEYMDEHFYSYAYKTGELTDLSETLMKAGIDDIGNLSLDGNVLSILIYEEEFIKLTRYNLDTGSLANKVISLTAKQLDADQIVMGITKNNRLYILSHKNDIPKVAVLDETNGAIRYTGEIVYDGKPLGTNWTMSNVERIYMEIAE